MRNVFTFSPTWILKDVSVEFSRLFLINDSVFGFEEIFDFGDDAHGFLGFVYYALFSMYSKLALKCIVVNFTLHLFFRGVH